MAAERQVRDGEVLTLQEAAEQLKVHYMTAYRWVRKGELRAFKAGGRLRVRTTDLEQFARDREVDTGLGMQTQAPSRRDWPMHVDRLHELLLSGAAVGAASLVHKVVADGAPAGDVYLQLLTPALYRIGEDWAADRISIAVEHRATEIAARLVAGLGECFRRRGPSRGSAATLTPTGEHHGLGAAMVADFLRGSGYEVHHLGCDVPTADLVQFLRRVAVDVTCISVTNPMRWGGAGAIATAAAREAGSIVVVGGQGADPVVVEAAGGIYVRQLVELGPLLENLTSVG